MPQKYNNHTILRSSEHALDSSPPLLRKHDPLHEFLDEKWVLPGHVSSPEATQCPQIWLSSWEQSESIHLTKSNPKTSKHICWIDSPSHPQHPHRCTAGWWFGTFFIFPYIWNNNPNWLSYFSEGWPNHQPDSHQASISHQPSSSSLHRAEALCCPWAISASWWHGRDGPRHRWQWSFVVSDINMDQPTMGIYSDLQYFSGSEFGKKMEPLPYRAIWM